MGLHINDFIFDYERILKGFLNTKNYGWVDNEYPINQAFSDNIVNEIYTYLKVHLNRNLTYNNVEKNIWNYLIDNFPKMFKTSIPSSEPIINSKPYIIPKNFVK